MRTDPRVFRDLRPGNGLHNSLTGSRPGVEVGVKTKFKKKKIIWSTQSRGSTKIKQMWVNMCWESRWRGVLYELRADYNYKRLKGQLLSYSTPFNAVRRAASQFLRPLRVYSKVLPFIYSFEHSLFTYPITTRVSALSTLHKANYSYDKLMGFRGRQANLVRVPILSLVK